MKKIINAPSDFVDEVIDGLLAAHPQLRATGADRRALVRSDAGTGDRVGIVTGGGSGHLPLFLGYVGLGLASGVAVGNVFSSPSAAQIHAATMASDAGRGVLYLYGNYGGDVYNFDIAADLAAADGVRTTTVVGTDDILSAPRDAAATRRGVAGLILAYKTAGAAAERGDDLDQVTRIAQKTVDATRTMGVGLSPTILPAAGEPTFTLDEGEMEVGIGIHGEPGRHRGPLESADEITDRFIAELDTELDLGAGARVAVLVNGLGATPPEELYVIYRRVHQVLTGRGVSVHRNYIGEYATSLEMAGASLSILVLDDELADLVDAPAWSPFFAQGGGEPQPAAAGTTGSAAGSPVEPATHGAGAPAAAPAEQVRTSAVDGGRFRELVLAVTTRLPAHAEELRELDAAVGDGDLGITVGSGADAVHGAVAALPVDAHPAEVLRTAGVAFAAANPSTFAALLGGGLLAASVQAADIDSIGPAEAALLVRAVQHRIAERGGAEVGDKTVLDVLDAVAAAIESDTESDIESGSELDSAAVAVAAAAAAERVVLDGADRQARRGRAGWLAERSIGHRDPGSVAALRMSEEVAAQLSSDPGPAG